jgi:hypothetical protein
MNLPEDLVRDELLTASQLAITAISHMLAERDREIIRLRADLDRYVGWRTHTANWSGSAKWKKWRGGEHLSDLWRLRSLFQMPR